MTAVNAFNNGAFRHKIRQVLLHLRGKTVIVFREYQQYTVLQICKLIRGTGHLVPKIKQQLGHMDIQFARIVNVDIAEHILNVRILFFRNIFGMAHTHTYHGRLKP